MEYSKIFQRLYENEIRYLICGGLAMNIYGIPRMTVDIDLLLDLNKENINKFQKVLKQLKYHPLLPVELEKFSDEKTRRYFVNKRNLIAYSYYNQISNYLQLDVLIDAPL